MAAQLDLEPAAIRMIRLIEAVPGDALDLPTPCDHYCVGDLLDHIHGAALAFAAAAAKRPLDGGPSGDAARLPDDWRTSVPRAVAALTAAWRDLVAWTGTTRAGGIELPAAMAGVVALDELVIHGWDLARALDLPAGYNGPGLEAVHANVLHFRSSGIDGIFGPAVEVPDDAPLFDRILGLSRFFQWPDLAAAPAMECVRPVAALPRRPARDRRATSGPSIQQLTAPRRPRLARDHIGRPRVVDWDEIAELLESGYRQVAARLNR